ncbi:MAG TPA: glycoside hydrolase, partial [Sulfitobacter sp.]|nr:glycoside hydrolase [Sulfitobacter sp.]
MILRRALILSLLALAACGRPSTSPPADPGTLFPARFGDSDPVDFNGRTPQSFPVHGIDVARFQNNIDWDTARRNGVNFAFIKATEGGDLKDIN